MAYHCSLSEMIKAGDEWQNCVWLNGDHIDFFATELLTGNVEPSTVAYNCTKYKKLMLAKNENRDGLNV